MNLSHLAGLSASNLIPIIVLSFATLVAQEGSDEPAATGLSVDRWSRNAVAAFWHRYYLPDQQSYPEVYGNPTDIFQDVVPDNPVAFENQVQRRINFYRALVGLPGDISFDESEVTRNETDTFDPPTGTTRREACRQAAYWMSRNAVASHTPNADLSSEWSVNDVIKNAAANSNLTLGAFGPAAINNYIREPGTDDDPLFNQEVGHRRAILFSRAAIMATGDVQSELISEDGESFFRHANALYVIGDFRDSQPGQFTAWPNDGYCPMGLVPEIWSLSRAGADFQNASVTMADPEGNNIPVVVRSRSVGIGVDDPPSDLGDGSPTGPPRSLGDATLSWQPAAGSIASIEDIVFQDVTYTVTVSGIEGDSPSSFSYSVTFFNPDRLNESMALTGSLTPPLSGAAYAFEQVPEVESYDFEITVPSATDWVEGGEDSQFLQQNPRILADELYRSTAKVHAGERAIVLSYPDPSKPGNLFNFQSVVFNHIFVPQSGAEVLFSYFQGFVATTSTVAVEVTNDGGISWREIWSRVGTNETIPTAEFTNESADLSAFIGQTLSMRLIIKKESVSTSSFFHGFTQDGQPVPVIGAYFDEVRVTNSIGPGVRRIVKLPPTAMKGIFSGASLGQDLLAGERYELRARAVLGGFRFGWGPTLEVLPANLTMSNSWEDYVAYTAPSLQSFTGDADGDGLSNGLEFVLGRDALEPVESSTVQEATVEGDAICLSVPVSDMPVGVSLGAEFSEDGLNWSSEGATVEVVNNQLKARAPMNGRKTLLLRWTATEN